MLGFKRCKDCGLLIWPWSIRGTLFEKDGKTSVYRSGGGEAKYTLCNSCVRQRFTEEHGTQLHCSICGARFRILCPKCSPPVTTVRKEE